MFQCLRGLKLFDQLTCKWRRILGALYGKPNLSLLCGQIREWTRHGVRSGWTLVILLMGLVIVLWGNVPELVGKWVME